jgi:hypothetical protein
LCNHAFQLDEVAGKIGEIRISRPYDEEDDRKSFSYYHKSTELQMQIFLVHDPFKEKKDPQITEKQAV